MEYADYLATREMPKEFLGEDPRVTQIEEQDTPSHLPASEELPKLSRRSKNFSDNEDEKLVSAWLNTGIDPPVGTQQKAGSFWVRIHQLYEETCTPEQHRTKKALEHRWSYIQERMNKFCGCLDQIQRLRASESNEHEKIADACKMFKQLHKKGFHLLHCWRILRNHPKWNNFLSVSKSKAQVSDHPSSSVPVIETPKTYSSVNLDDNTPSTGSDYMKRPLDKKAVKKRGRDGTESSYNVLIDELCTDRRETDEKVSQMQERTLAVEREMVAIKEKVWMQENELQLKREQLKFEQQMRCEQLELEKQKGFWENTREQERIMTIDLASLGETAKAFYMQLQQDILHKQMNK